MWAIKAVGCRRRLNEQVAIRHTDAVSPRPVRRSVTLAQLGGQAAARGGDEWCLWFACDDGGHGDVEDFPAYVPGPGAAQQAAVELLRAFLPELRRLDGFVQQSCEREWREGGLNPSNYELYAAHVSPATDGETVVVEYYGTVVNTQWQAMFRLAKASGLWEPANFQP